jgi:guanylate kinase
MGKLIILGGPSCSGKTVIKKGLIDSFPKEFKSLITATTREARLGEKHGVDCGMPDKNFCPLLAKNSVQGVVNAFGQLA